MPARDQFTGLLLVGHGTRSEVGTREFLVLARSLAERMTPLPVEPAFLELQQPNISAAVARLVDHNIKRLATMPLLLFAAGHAKQDIPQAVKAALAARGCGNVEHVQADHLGCHPAIVELSKRRMQDAWAGTPEADTCLVLVGRGSNDESATAEMQVFARLRQQQSDAMGVEVAFLAMARPLLKDKLDEIACHSFRRVIVQPHLLFQGELVESIASQVSEMAAKHPELEWIVTQPLAGNADFVTPGSELIQKTILDRCRQAGIHVVAAGADD